MSCDVKHPVGAKGQSIALPVLPAGSPAGPHERPHMPRSRMGWKRATVLISIQLLMIAHVLQWLMTGSTLSPVEPSESMATFKDGVINAGAVVFGLGLLSTVILGRWFCGWGCHIVMLQDFCAWLMERVGIRPKPFRSRLLLFVPLALAIYMFLWPVFYRLAIAPYTRPELRWPGFSTAFIVEDFWATFPGLLMSIPFILICAFLTVYLLGAKGYCTYGCPYGGFFAPLDELAVGRIRVNDACEHCGHCTAVCSSNVRVHEEVRDYGMVVDPGCMKCMDCVSACPNNALSFGFGKPAALATARTAAPKQRSFDLSMREEVVFAIVAILSFLATRGSFGFSLPLLFSSGVAACVTYLSWKAWRILRDRDSRFHRWQLRRAGAIRPAGWAWITATGLVLLLTLHSAVVNSIGFVASWYDDRVTTLPEVVFSENPIALEPSMAAAAERALDLYDTIRLVGQGGIGIFPPIQASIDQRRAWLQSALGRYDEAERTLRAGIERDGLSESYAGGIGRVLRGQRNPEAARAWYTETLAAQPLWMQLQDDRVQWLVASGFEGEAVAAARAALANARTAGATPAQDLFLMRRLSLLLVEHGVGQEIQEGIDLTEETLKIEPDNPFAFRALAIGHARLERMDQAEQALRRAIELAPEDWRLLQSLGELLMGIGKQAEGATVIKEATKLRDRR